MKLNQINDDSLILEEIKHSKVITEDIIGVVDKSIEVVAGIIGFVPVAGAPADIAMMIKNLFQKDYLGASLWAISAIPEPTFMTDTICKLLRIIQLSASQNQKDKINEAMEELYKRTNGRAIESIKDMWDNLKEQLDNVSTKLKLDDGVSRTKRYFYNIFKRIFDVIEDSIPDMEEYLSQFLVLIQNKFNELNDPVGGIDIDDIDCCIEDKIKKIRVKARSLKNDLYSKKMVSKNFNLFNTIKKFLESDDPFIRTVAMLAFRSGKKGKKVDDFTDEEIKDIYFKNKEKEVLI